MPKILSILNRMSLGGPVIIVSYLTKYLVPDFETRLIVGAKDDHEEDASFFTKNLGLEYTEIPTMMREINFKKDWQSYQEIKKIIREFKPDIVHTHAAKSGVIGRLAAFSCKVPVVVHTFHGHVFHSYFGNLKTWMFLQIERYLAKRSTRIIAISEQQRQELTEEFKVCAPEKLSVIPLGLDLEHFHVNLQEKRTKFRNEYSIQPDEIVIGIIARIVPIKNHILFIDAIHEVIKSSTKKIRVLIVGDGDERQAVMTRLNEYQIPFNYFPENKLPQPVTFTSWLTEMDEVYAGIDIVALTSLNEGTPVSLIEAQAANKPIVTTDVGGVRDVIIENQTAFVTPSGDAHAFALALLKLTEDEALREHMGSDGYQFVKDQFGTARLIRNTRALYYELLDEKHVSYQKIGQ